MRNLQSAPRHARPVTSRRSEPAVPLAPVMDQPVALTLPTEPTGRADAPHRARTRARPAWGPGGRTTPAMGWFILLILGIGFVLLILMFLLWR